MDELKLDFSVFVSSMKHMPPWNEDQNNEHLNNTIRILLEKCSGGRTMEMLKDVLSTEERRALLITNDQFSNQNENETTNRIKVRQDLKSESSHDKNSQNSVPTENDKERISAVVAVTAAMVSAISENVINENYTSTSDLTSSKDKVPLYNVEEEIVSTQDTEMKETKFFACPLCPKTFANHQNFLPHAAQFHFQEQLKKNLPHSAPFDCPICSKNMKSLSNLVLHYAMKHDMLINLLNKKGYRIISTRKGIIPIQETEMIETIRFSCPLCPKTFTTQKNIVLHATQVHFQEELKKDLPSSEPFECPICSTNMNKLSLLVLHYAIEHDMVIKLLNEKDETAIKGKKLTKQIQYTTCHLCPDKHYGFEKQSLIRHVIHHHFFEKLCEELPAGMDQYKCPKCSHICKDIRKYAVHYGIVHKMVKIYMKEVGFKDEAIKGMIF